MAFVKNIRSRTYRVKYMTMEQFQEVLHQSRYEKIRIDNTRKHNRCLDWR